MQTPNGWDDRYKQPMSKWDSDIMKYHDYIITKYATEGWRGLADIEQKAIRQERAKKMQAKMVEAYHNKSPDEKAAIAQRKSEGSKAKTPEEKVAQSERNRQASNKFWSGLQGDDRKEFSQRRYDSISDENKKIIIDNLVASNKTRMSNLTDDEKKINVDRMNAAYKLKWDTDEVFKNEQIMLLRKHNREFFENASDETLMDIYKRSGETRSKLWENIPFEERQSIMQPVTDAYIRYYNDLTDDQKAEKLRLLNEGYERYRANATEEELREVRRKALIAGSKDNKLHARFEKMFAESMLSKKYTYIKEFILKNNDVVKSWDFAVFDEKANLISVVDIDGAFFHGDDNYDYIGSHGGEHYDERRSLSVPNESIKICIINENNFTKTFARFVRDTVIDYDLYIKSKFNEYRKCPFPYPKYDNNILLSSWNKLRDFNCDKFYNDYGLANNRMGDKLINHYHNSMYKSNLKGKLSPFDAWHDDELFMEAIINRTVYQTTLNPNKILQGFNISRIAPKVTVFSAGRAKMLINRYLSEFDTVFDPFSGFSGRMLGTISLGKTYIGQDICRWHVQDSNKILDFIREHSKDGLDINATVEQKCIYESNGIYDCLFTCPPYELKESWWGVDLINHSCDEWIKESMKRFKCKRYMYVVDKTEEFKDYIVDEIVNKSHLTGSSEYVILI